MTTRRTARTVLTLCALVSAAAGAGACDRADPAQQTIVEVSRAFDRLHAGGVHPEAIEARRAAYSEAVTMLASVGPDATAAQRAAAQSLLAQAWNGRAQLHIAEATDLERQLLNDISEVRASVRLVESRLALAAALEAYDPAEEIGEAERATAEVSRRLDEAAQLLARVQAEVARLHAEAEDQAKRGSDLRQREGEMRSSIADAPVEQRPELAGEVVALQRRADAFDVQAARLNAEAARIAPQADEIQRDIDRLRRQTELWAQARTVAEERAASSRQEAGANREAVGEVVERLRARLSEIASRRAEELAPVYEEAERALSSAISAMLQSAQAAVSPDSRAAAQAALGRLHLNMADLHQARASGAAALARLLNSAAAEVGEAGLRDAITVAQAEAQEAQAAADEARQEAASAFERAGGRGEAGEMLSRLASDLAGQPGETPEGGAPDAPVDGGETP